jgi:hypothetical protein
LHNVELVFDTAISHLQFMVHISYESCQCSCYSNCGQDHISCVHKHAQEQTRLPSVILLQQ